MQKGPVFFGNTFQRGAVEGFHLVSFADADYASEATDRRSVSGGGSDMSGGARLMVLADSEMHNAVNHAGRVCRDVGYCEGDFVFEADLVFYVAED